ncbi:copper chaperone PCu(A)C [Nonomuraea turcica]|uniref:copper chaperone PCu(A)C n=1 Tax=Nonomuraea sp. G32 TaxID=3067274 RepID=UPI00273B83BE|nr:copper chaperone PCu(A)C [Nonomuraea sp. G32]MDP4505453.1 copper chaperone PCu(A)C [Nonomuraea sp. G32]
MSSRTTIVVLSMAAAAALSACGTTPQAAPAAAVATPSASPTRPAGAAALAITDPWVKTAKKSNKGMTAAFGTLVNNSDADITVVSGTSPLSPKVELHEVVEAKGKMVMQPKKGGFVIPARGSLTLQPGGDHIMLVGLAEEVKPGAQISFTLTLADGGTFAFTALGKDFAGAKEDYQPGMDMGGSDG